MRKSESIRSSNNQELTDPNKIVFSTQVPIKSNKEGVFEWWRFFQMHFDCDKNDKDKSFTVSLFRTKKGKKKSEKLGQSRSFFLIHLKHQELKEVNLEFKDSYESKSQGRVIMRMQYIKDEITLYAKILDENIKRKDLILKWIDILNKQIQSHRESEQKLENSPSIEDQNLEWGSHNAGFYSEYGGSSIIGDSSSLLQTYYKNGDNSSSFISLDHDNKSKSVIYH